MGFYAAKQRLDKVRFGILKGFMAAIAILGFYDVFIFFIPVAEATKKDSLIMICFGGFMVLIIGSGLVLRRLVRKALVEDDADIHLNGFHDVDALKQ